MKRNTIFGAASLLVAGAAIGAGAVASGNAMAGSDTPAADENTVEVITATVGDDGTSDAFSCTIEGMEFAPAMEIPMDGTLPDGAPTGVIEVGGGSFEISTLDSLPEGMEIGEVVVGEAVVAEGVVVGEPAVGKVGIVSFEGELPLVDDTELHIIDPADVREGTAEECAGITTRFEVTAAP